MPRREPPDDFDDLWDRLSEQLADDGQLARLTERLVRERLVVKLPVLVDRGVPVRGLTQGPLSGVGRLRLADSTVLLVRSVAPGDLSRVVGALVRHRTVTVAGWECTPEALTLTLAGVPGRPPLLEVVGQDQPD